LELDTDVFAERCDGHERTSRRDWFMPGMVRLPSMGRSSTNVAGIDKNLLTFRLWEGAD
jgi:hypothetical protein